LPLPAGDLLSHSGSAGDTFDALACISPSSSAEQLVAPLLHLGVDGPVEDPRLRVFSR
jgi:hypothetical protein